MPGRECLAALLAVDLTLYASDLQAFLLVINAQIDTAVSKSSGLPVDGVSVAIGASAASIVGVIPVLVRIQREIRAHFANQVSIAAVNVDAAVGCK